MICLEIDPLNQWSKIYLHFLIQSNMLASHLVVIAEESTEVDAEPFVSNKFTLPFEFNVDS